MPTSSSHSHIDCLHHSCKATLIDAAVLIDVDVASTRAIDHLVELYAHTIIFRCVTVDRITVSNDAHY